MTQKISPGEYKIRLSTDEDMITIYDWLKEQRSRSVEATFHCNWNITVRMHEERKLLVSVKWTR